MFSAVSAAAQANPSKIRIEGNLGLDFEFRRDADAEYGDRELGYDRAFTRSGRPYFDLRNVGRQAAFRAYAYPVQPIEIYAGVFHQGDFVGADGTSAGLFDGEFMGDGHVKLRVVRESGDRERGFESFFFYRQGRLAIGDPRLSIAYDNGRSGDAGGDNHNGIATSWWLGRGDWTFDKGKWSGELNFQDFPNERGSYFNPALVTITDNGIRQGEEDNEGYAAKIRHDYKYSNDLNIANEIIWAHKTFGFTDPLSASTLSPADDFRRPYNDVFGVDLQIAYKTTNFAIQYHPFSRGNNVGLHTPQNDALGVDLRNLMLLDKPWSGRVGLNANYTHFGRNYRAYMGRQAEFIPFGYEIRNGGEVQTGGLVSDDYSAELYWDVPKYRINVTLRHNDKDAANGLNSVFALPQTLQLLGSDVTGATSNSGLRLIRKNEIDINMRLIKNIDFRALYSRQRFGLERALYDFDAQRYLRFANKLEQNLYLSLKMNRQRGSLKVDYRNLQQRTVNFQVAGVEGSYKLTDRIDLLARSAQIFIERPDQNFAITKKPDNFGVGSEYKTSIVDQFFSRVSSFFQITYRPTDNAKLYLEYGAGFHTDNDLSLDGDLLAATRRTEPRVLTKMELWF